MTAPPRCYQTFSGLWMLSCNMAIYTSTWSRMSASETVATESTSSTTWNTTSVTAAAETIFFKLGTLEAGPFVVRFRDAGLQASSNPA